MGRIPSDAEFQQLRRELREVRASIKPAPGSGAKLARLNTELGRLDRLIQTIQSVLVEFKALFDLEPTTFSKEIKTAGGGIDLDGGQIRSTSTAVPYVQISPHWDDFRVAPQSMDSIPAVDGPELEKIGDDGGGSVGVFGLAFDKTKRESVSFDIQLPHSYREGTAIEPHAHWCPTNTDTGSVVWELELTTFANVGEVIGTVTTVIDATDAADGTAYKHQVIGLPSIDMTDKEVSTIAQCRVARRGADASDTYNADAILLSFDFHIQNDSIGSEGEFTKAAVTAIDDPPTEPEGGIGGGGKPDPFQTQT